MNTRIKELRLALNLTQKEFGNKIGLKSSISDIEIGRAPITERTIISICTIYNVNEDWLRTGNGNMFVDHNSKLDEFLPIFNNLSPVLQDFIVTTAKNLLDCQDKL